MQRLRRGSLVGAVVIAASLGAAATALGQQPTPYQTITATGAGLDKVFLAVCSRWARTAAGR